MSESLPVFLLRSLARCLRRGRSTRLGLLALCLISILGPRAHAQFVQSAVGGVLIDANGVVRSLSAEMERQRSAEMRAALAAIPPGLDAPADMRKISLKTVDAELRRLRQEGLPVPDALRYLGGLTRIEYVLVQPEDQDVILAGPAEAWTVSNNGTLVGQRSGQPIVLLEDLLVAMQTAASARQVGISCSIDPTAEGRRALDQFLSRQSRFSPQMLNGVEKALGPQQITLTGVPQDTHFACVLVAADYQMKRYAMKLENAPVQLPSYLDLLQASRTRVTNMTPRWWMACNYQPIARNAAGTLWKLRGPGVRVATEDHIAAADGSVQQTGRANPVAQEWADIMTDKYAELSVAAPVFGQLRNVMDLAVVAALIENEQLLARANCQLALLGTPASDPLLTRWHMPKTVASQSSFIKRGRDYIITASGGIQLTSWHVVQETAVDQQLEQLSQQLPPRPETDGWHWD